MCVWRVSLQSTKSTIISWDGSNGSPVLLQLGGRVLFTTDDCYAIAENMLKVHEPPHNKTNKMTVHPAKTQISLGICPVWSESSLCTQRSQAFFMQTTKTDQTGQTSRLIWVFAVCTCHFVGFVMLWLKWNVVQLSQPIWERYLLHRWTGKAQANTLHILAVTSEHLLFTLMI